MMRFTDHDSGLPKIGLMLPYEGDCSAEGLVQVASAAESSGLDSVWVGDHIAFPVEMNSINPTMSTGKYPYPLDNPRLEAFTALAFIAGATSTIRLGVNACVVPYRNPLLLGKVVSTLDHLSNGRVVFGATLGWCSEEFEALGVEFGTRRQRLEEGIEILRLLGAKCSHDWSLIGDNFYEVFGFKLTKRFSQHCSGDAHLFCQRTFCQPFPGRQMPGNNSFTQAL